MSRTIFFVLLSLLDKDFLDLIDPDWSLLQNVDFAGSEEILGHYLGVHCLASLSSFFELVSSVEVLFYCSLRLNYVIIGYLRLDKRQLAVVSTELTRGQRSPFVAPLLDVAGYSLLRRNFWDWGVFRYSKRLRLIFRSDTANLMGG